MKGKRLLILGAAFALGLSACANGATMVRKAPLKASITGTFEKTEVADLSNGDEIVIVSTKGTASYAMANNKGTSAAPTAVSVTISNNAITNPDSTIVWTFEKDGDNYSFKTSTNHLYCINNNNGLRVGTNEDNKFIIEESGYLFNVAQSRYVGVYNNENWRSYTSINNNIKDQTFSFYKNTSSQKTISLSVTESTLEVGDTVQLLASENGVNWSTSNENVATVSNGLVTGIGVGSATITASLSGFVSASCSITVVAAVNYGSQSSPLNVESAIAVIDGSPALTRHPLFVKGIISGATYETQYSNYTVWLQSDDGQEPQAFELYALIIDTNEFGDFSANASSLVGYEITATGYGQHYTGNNKSIYELNRTTIGENTVYPTTLELNPPQEILLNKTELTLEVEEEEQLIATIPTGATGVVWASDNSGIAQVDQQGNVTAVAVGTANISVSANGLDAAVCQVTVEPATDYGTENSPLNITGAIAAIDKNPAQTKKPLYVKGIVSEASYSSKYSNYTIWLKSDDGLEDHAFELYALVIDANQFGDFSADASALVGYEVTATGYGTLHNDTTYELTYVTIDGNRVDPEVVALKAPKLSPQEKIAKLDSNAKLSYVFAKEDREDTVVDILNNALTGIDGTTYAAWSGKKSNSNAVYAGQSAGGNSSIQLRSNNSNSGVITTASGGNATKVSVVWNVNTTNGRTVNIYGSNSAYASAADLYATDKQGTLLGTFTYGENQSTELEISDAYAYIGIRSASGALYLDEVDITWSGIVSSINVSKATIRFGGLLQKALWDDLDLDSKIAGYGVMFATESAVAGGELKELTPNDTTIFNRYTALTETKLNPTLANAEQKVGLEDADADYYIWNLCINITASEYFKDSFVSVAYIQLENGNKVFMKQTSSASVKSLAANMLADGVEDDGALSYLANI